MEAEVMEQHDQNQIAGEDKEIAENSTIPTSPEDDNSNNEKSSRGQEIREQPAEDTRISISKELEVSSVPPEPEITKDKTQNLQTNLEIPMETDAIRVKEESDNCEILLDEGNMPNVKETEPQPQINNVQNQDLQTHSEIPMETNAIRVKEEPDNCEMLLDEGNMPNVKETEPQPQINNVQIQDLQTNSEIPMETNAIRVKEEPNNCEMLLDEGNMPNVKETEPQPQINNDKTLNLQTNSEIPMETNAIRVKEEPDHFEIPIDENMPIAKDLDYLSVNHNDRACRISDEVCNRETTNSALDKELQDGIATAVMPARPRLRVKPEFSLLQANTNTQPTSIETAKNCANSLEHLNKEELMPPPPPPISSNSNSDFLADGIATPRISLLAVNRLRVKTEFSSQSDEPDNVEDRIPEDFFDDLLESKCPKEDGEVSDNDSNASSEDIPADFFDDLLTPAVVKESLDQENTEEHEEKYSETLREQDDLRKHKSSKHKSHKKQKKSKKKTRKRSRSRSRSRSPKYNVNRERDYRSISPNSLNVEDNHCNRLFPGLDRKRSRLSPSGLDHLPSTSRDYYRNRDFQLNDSLWPQEVSQRVKQEGALPPEENNEEIERTFTPKQKRENAIKRATALLNRLKNTSSSENFITTAFQFVSTVRKLPASHSYVQQQIYENRSPLHTINNVSYKFNSYKTRFNLEEWGLATLPTNAAQIAKRVGCNAQFIYEKLKTITIPAKLRKIKNESNEQDNEEGEELVETNSSLFCNAMTQTDEGTGYESLNKEKYDVAIQAVPDSYSIACQTLEIQSPTANTHDEDEAPIMKIIRDLNENQLMAIHSFAELIKEPPVSSATAMEMYKIQTKIMDIYKISQIPSAVMPKQTQIVNKYTTKYRTTTTSTVHRNESSTQPIIQSVQSADGLQFSIHDPRVKSSAYNSNIINNFDPRHNRSEGGHTTFSAVYNTNSRHYGNPHSAQSSSSYQQYRQFPPHTHNQALPPAPVKKYGRGALKR